MRKRTAPIWLLAILVFVAAGCATLVENKLSQARRDALRIDIIEPSFAPDADIAWLDALPEFQQTKQPDTPQARRAFFEQKATGKIKAALDAEIQPAFRGTEPARLKIVIRRLSVPSAFMRAVLGSDQNSIKADVQLLDHKTGEILLDAPSFTGLASAGGGIAVIVDPLLGDPINRVSKNFARALKSWLQTGQAFASG